MALNKQGPDKIDWTDYTWNPISGCLHGCDYCYMRRMQKRFKDIMKPAFHPDRLDDIKRLQKPSNIFVGSSGDMWGHWVPDKWIMDVLDVVKKYPQHRFQFLTKNPVRYKFFNLPVNAIYGTTIDGTEKTNDNLSYLVEAVHTKNKMFVSFEPLIDFMSISISYIIDYIENIDWIIIGADSNHNAKKPPLHWAGALIALAKEFEIPVFVKNNYNYPEKFKEMPK